MACILLWSSAVRVHDSQAYRKMDVTRERISRISALWHLWGSPASPFERPQKKFSQETIRANISRVSVCGYCPTATADTWTHKKTASNHATYSWFKHVLFKKNIPTDNGIFYSPQRQTRWTELVEHIFPTSLAKNLLVGTLSPVHHKGLYQG